MVIKAILTDIEGTTSSIDFVHRVLFPYSAQALPQYLRQHYQEPEIASIIEQVKQEIGEQLTPPRQVEASIDRVIDRLLDWIKADQKITPLKTLQGFIWEDGFKSNQFKSHVYEDAYRNLNDWHQAEIKLYIFSSGSEKAQKLLFGHSEFGDLTYLFTDYFDTKIGNKKQTNSYQRIAQKINFETQEILFLSDVIAELDAAANADYNVTLLARNELPSYCPHQVVRSFDEIEI